MFANFRKTLNPVVRSSLRYSPISIKVVTLIALHYNTDTYTVSARQTLTHQKYG